MYHRRARVILIKKDARLSITQSFERRRKIIIFEHDTIRNFIPCLLIGTSHYAVSVLEMLVLQYNVIQVVR